MNDDQLKFDRTRHVLYSKVCKKEIQKRIALHYPEDRQEAPSGPRSRSGTPPSSPTGPWTWAAGKTSKTAKAAPTTASP